MKNLNLVLWGRMTAPQRILFLLVNQTKKRSFTKKYYRPTRNNPIFFFLNRRLVIYFYVCLLFFFMKHTLACTVACCADHRGQDDALSDGKAALQCFNCCGSLVVLAMWIITLVYLCMDCYSVVMVAGVPTAFKCWENL